MGQSAELLTYSRLANKWVRGRGLACVDRECPKDLPAAQESFAVSLGGVTLATRLIHAP